MVNCKPTVVVEVLINFTFIHTVANHLTAYYNKFISKSFLPLLCVLLPVFTFSALTLLVGWQGRHPVDVETRTLSLQCFDAVGWVKKLVQHPLLSRGNWLTQI